MECSAVRMGLYRRLGVAIAAVLVAGSLAVSQGYSKTVSVADYGAKGDGKADDAPAVRAAIAAVAREGGTVRFPAGTYLLRRPQADGSQIHLPSKVTLASDEGAKLVDAGHTVGQGDWWQKATVVKITSATDCEIRGLDIKSPGPAIYMTDVQRCLVRDCHFHEHSSMSIYAARSSLVEVRDCVFEQMAYGLYLQGPIRWRIANNRIRRAVWGMELQGANSCQILGNWIDGEGGGMVGILMFPNSDPRFGGFSTVGNLVANNDVRGVPEEGISLDCRGGNPKTYYGVPGTVTSADATSFTDAQGDAELLKLAPTCCAIITQGRGAGQYRRVDSVQGTKLSVSPEWGVIPDSTSQYCLLRAGVGNQIIGNRSQAGMTGIFLYGACLGNLVSDNIVDALRDGIGVASLRPDIYERNGKTYDRFLASWYNLVTGNIIARHSPGKPGGMGIFLTNFYGGTESTIRNYGNRVFNNMITDCGTGISLDWQRGAIVTDNSIYLATDPIKQGEGLAGCVVERNTVTLPGQ